MPKYDIIIINFAIKESCALAYPEIIRGDRNMDKNTDIRLEQTIVDKNFKEIKQHGTDGFPFVVYKDDFFRFEYGLILWHWHEEVQFTLVAEGEVHMLIGDKELVLSEGEGIFINSKVLHQLQPQLKNKGCVISFIWKTSLLENDVLSDVYLNCILPVLKGEDYKLLSESEKRVLFKIVYLYDEKATGYQLKIKEHLCNIWNSMLTRQEDYTGVSVRFNSRDIQRVKRCITYIHNNYDKKISLEQIAAAAHISKSEVCRCFKKILHQTPFEYLIRYRVIQACSLLKRSDCSVTEAASLTGFDSISHMGRFFHKYLKQSPSHFKNHI